jgi:hypothetical protein
MAPHADGWHRASVTEDELVAYADALALGLSAERSVRCLTRSRAEVLSLLHAIVSADEDAAPLLSYALSHCILVVVGDEFAVGPGASPMPSR